MYYVTMQITFLTRKFRNVERNLHCDVVHITTVWVSIASLSIAMAFSREMPINENKISQQKYFCQKTFNISIRSVSSNELTYICVTKRLI